MCIFVLQPSSNIFTFNMTFKVSPNVSTPPKLPGCLGSKYASISQSPKWASFSYVYVYDLSNVPWCVVWWVNISISLHCRLIRVGCCHLLTRLRVATSHLDLKSKFFFSVNRLSDQQHVSSEEWHSSISIHPFRFNVYVDLILYVSKDAKHEISTFSVL